MRWGWPRAVRPSFWFPNCASTRRPPPCTHTHLELGRRLGLVLRDERLGDELDGVHGVDVRLAGEDRRGESETKKNAPASLPDRRASLSRDSHHLLPSFHSSGRPHPPAPHQLTHTHTHISPSFSRGPGAVCVSFFFSREKTTARSPLPFTLTHTTMRRSAHLLAAAVLLTVQVRGESERAGSGGRGSAPPSTPKKNCPAACPPSTPPPDPRHRRRPHPGRPYPAHHLPHRLPHRGAPPVRQVVGPPVRGRVAPRPRGDRVHCLGVRRPPQPRRARV